MTRFLTADPAQRHRHIVNVEGVVLEVYALPPGWPGALPSVMAVNVAGGWLAQDAFRPEFIRELEAALLAEKTAAEGDE